jgi:hypothetical protein
MAGTGNRQRAAHGRMDVDRLRPYAASGFRWPKSSDVKCTLFLRLKDQ